MYRSNDVCHLAAAYLAGYSLLPYIGINLRERTVFNCGILLINDVKNILLVRTDRIGDVILSLPMLPLLRRRFPSAKISVLVREYTRELVEHHSCVDEVLVYEHEDSLRSLWAILSNVRRRKFDAAIIPYPRFRPALISFLAGVRLRVGSGYRWYSFLFNRRVFEHRKDARRHEVEYNINLLRVLDVPTDGPPAFEFTATQTAKKSVDSVLAQYDIKPSERFAVLHPGSGGSAREWRPENFSDLGSRLNAVGIKVVVSGGRGEEKLVQKVVDGIKGFSAAVVGRLSLTELGALISRADVFVSNSTGPMHIAAVVGTPVVGFFPPMIQCSPVRWGPYTEKKKIFVADNNRCPLCQGGACRSNVCMDEISVDQAFHAVKELLHD
ncbi:MAG TPA: glycosyltransferase family 9 protein [Bacteroidota bacterium]|nr:glycosyltransferase family 9 protein [Bacteroidota bacterium]